ncbi:hypothetical protein CFE70_010171 [Pyrenophora teres f. teres 0-1]|uniref:Uncharacterized protein n=2 Tax=Pyrenophora teres f. teres TaxID=97479 RepID=E3RL08_PYRTT|nr:hypothetical protein PTT_08981 [Pyrenophora teres f. teres 0-1]
MASQGDISYTGIFRHSDQFWFSDFSLDAQPPNYTSHEDQRSLERAGHEYPKSLPGSSMSTTTVQSIPFTIEYKNANDEPIERKSVQWRISLYTPLSMISLFMFGLLVAVGHHLFYKRFDKTHVRGPGEDGASKYISQVWIIRYGTAFAFIAKTLLAGSIVVAYKQHMWINLRHKSHSVCTIDALFAATHDLLAFSSPSLWTKAPIPALMALVAWCLPLAALIVPSTLTVHQAFSTTYSPATVPTLNLSNSSAYSTMFGDGNSPLLRRLTLVTATGMQILPMSRVYPNHNASYEYEFDGPSLKCEKVTETRLQNMSAIVNETTRQILFAAQHYTGEADLRYVSFTTEKQGVNATGYNNVSNFVANCIVGIEGNTFPFCATITNTPILWTKMGDESITCTTYNTHFKAFFGAKGAQGDIYPVASIDYKWKEPVNTDVSQRLFSSLATILNGYFGTFTSGGASGGSFSSDTMIVTTALLEQLQKASDDLRSTVPQEPWMRSRENQTLGQVIEELSRNQTLSLFSNEALWLPPYQFNTTLVGFWEQHSEYEYLPCNLWLAYGIAIVLAFLSILLGLRAVWLNGVCHDNSFSSIMAATRNAYLDQLTLGHSLGATPMGKEILRTRLKFGVLGQEGESGEKGGYRAGFGVGDTVHLLEKGQHVY